jgi:hypothetical protein
MVAAGQVLHDRRPIALNARPIVRLQAELNQDVRTAEMVMLLQDRQEQRLSERIGEIVTNGDLQVRDRRVRGIRRRRDVLGVRSMLLVVERERGGLMRDVDCDE